MDFVPRDTSLKDVEVHLRFDRKVSQSGDKQGVGQLVKVPRIRGKIVVQIREDVAFIFQQIRLLAGMIYKIKNILISSCFWMMLVKCSQLLYEC